MWSWLKFCGLDDGAARSTVVRNAEARQRLEESREMLNALPTPLPVVSVAAAAALVNADGARRCQVETSAGLRNIPRAHLSLHILIGP